MPIFLEWGQHPPGQNQGSPAHWQEPLPMRRTVKRTAWSMRMGIADIPINQVPILNLMFEGWGSYLLRNISQGISTHPILCSNSATTLLAKHLIAMLGSQRVDIQAVSQHFWRQANPGKTNYHPSLTDSTQVMATEMMKFLAPVIKASQGSEDDKIQVLQKELDAARKRLASPTRTTQPSIPISPSKSQSSTERMKLDEKAAFKPLPGQRPLQNNCPTEKGTRNIDKWISQIKSTLSSEHSNKLDDYIKSVRTAWDAIDKKDRPSIADIAGEWGLPVTKAANWGEADLLRVSAVAAYQVAILTA